jgi:hypothetical protein
LEDRRGFGRAFLGLADLLLLSVVDALAVLPEQPGT